MSQLARLLVGLGGRRFLLTLGCGGVTALLQWFGKLDPTGTNYAIVTVGTVGAYIAGNVAQKRAEVKGSTP